MASGIDYVSLPDFQEDVKQKTEKWDKEWLRYFHIHDYAKWYFYDMNTDNYALSLSPKILQAMSRSEFYFAKPFKEYALGVWARGEDIVGKTVVELGCGPALFGKIVSRLARRYIGIDYSKLALKIAEIVSPSNCNYYHLSEMEQLRDWCESVDICVGRYFFIHQNFVNTRWILSFYRDLLKPGGLVSADFYHMQKELPGVTVLGCREGLHPEHASCVFNYQESEIREIADYVGLDIIAIDYLEEAQKCFVTFKKS